MKLKIILSVVFLLIVGLTVHVLTLRGVPGNFSDITTAGNLVREGTPFESSHERAPYAEMISIQTHHTIQLSKPLADFGSPDVGYLGNRYFSFFPSGVSASIIPGYLIGSYFNLGQVGAYFTMSIFAVITMIFIYFICRDIFELPVWASLIAPLTYAFGTTAWAYNVTIYQHAAAAMLSMAIFYCVWRYKQKGRKQIFWAAAVWFIYGISLFFDYPNALLLLPFMVYFLVSSLSVSMVKRRKKVLRISLNSAILRAMIVFILLIAYHGYHNAHYIGRWNMIGNNLPRYTIKTPAQIAQEKKDAAAKKQAAAQKPKGEKSASTIAHTLQEDQVPRNINILFLGNDKGMFLFSPVVLLAVLGFITIRKKPIMERSILLAFILTNIFIYSSFGDPYGGWAFGPRYLIPAMAGLSIYIAIGLAQTRLQTLRKILFVMLYAISSAIALSGALTTNLIPPKVEADYLKLNYYNFTHTFNLVQKNTASSYVYNTFFLNKYTLLQYAETIWMVLYICVVLILFILPLLIRDEVKEVPAK